MIGLILSDFENIFLLKPMQEGVRSVGTLYYLTHEQTKLILVAHFIMRSWLPENPPPDTQDLT